LWGGQYTWPDGYVEYDYEAKAGIQRDDPTDMKMEKIERLGEKEASREKLAARLIGAGILGFVAYLFARHFGMDQPGAVGAMACYGLFLLSRPA